MEAILFDFDGVIIDTEYSLFLSYKDIFLKYGNGKNLTPTEFALKLWDKWVHRKAIAYLNELNGKEIDINRMFTELKERERHYAFSLPLRPGIRETYGFCRQNQIKIAIVSSSPLDWVESHLNRFRGMVEFDNKITKEMVKETKPDPELYHKALEKLGCCKEDVIAIEDSPTGIKASKAAGIKTIGFPNLITKYLDLSEADLVSETLDEITILQIISRNPE